MMALSNTTGHAVRALSCLAGCTNPPANINDVAECADVPKAYLAKIVKLLNDAGIVASKRGSKGGIWLARPAKLISLLDISLALEGEDFLDGCLLGSDHCSDERTCPTHKFWIKNRELIRKELERTKLSDVLQFYQSREEHHMPDRAR
ncbi:Rrf2 family transcriptional regulator [Pontiellaceae bacterium B1224]|nr:Rrf2 family transcriptional regulator [Pontiellaceae bacterium B1224]